MLSRKKWRETRIRQELRPRFSEFEFRFGFLPVGVGVGVANSVLLRCPEKFVPFPLEAAVIDDIDDDDDEDDDDDDDVSNLSSITFAVLSIILWHFLATVQLPPPR